MLASWEGGAKHEPMPGARGSPWTRLLKGRIGEEAGDQMRSPAPPMFRPTRLRPVAP